MSGILKGIGKVFKKVVKVVKKIALPALAIGAVVLTGGAALGLLPAVGKVIGGLGLGATVTSVLTGAVTAAGYGAVIGGVTGGKDGFMKGAGIGAISGGLLGAVAPGLLAKIPGAMPGGGAAAAAPGSLAMDAGTAAIAGVPAAAAPAVATAAPAAIAVGTTAPVASGSIVKGLLASPILGQVVGGIGQGMAAKAQAEEKDIDRAAIAANYNIAGGPLGGLLSPYQTPSTGTTAGDSFGQMGQWVYDEQLGRLVRRAA